MEVELCTECYGLGRIWMIGHLSSTGRLGLPIPFVTNKLCCPKCDGSGAEIHEEPEESA